MKKITLGEKNISQGVKTDGSSFCFPAEGGDILLPDFDYTTERYFAFTAELEADNSGVFDFRFYAEGDIKPRFIFRFGMMPRHKTRMFLDLNLLDGHVLFPGHIPGQLKTVCHGSRIERKDIKKAVFTACPRFEPLRLCFEDLAFLDEPPQPLASPKAGKKMIDRFGQNALKEWKGKIHDEDELKKNILDVFNSTIPNNENKTAYSGNAGKKLIPGTGFFTSVKQNNRWYLADPEGCAFFSLGPDCVNPRIDGRIDGVENLLEWLPESGSKEEKLFIEIRKPIPGYAEEIGRGDPKMISFSNLNLYRVWGDAWYENWQKHTEKFILLNGMNTLGNWSDDRLFGKIRVPYVTSLPEFPGTKEFIFRDFPDVLSPEYAANAEKSAAAMTWKKDDPWMIGYFLRNEPGWAFVNELIIADEVFRNPAKTFCKTELIKRLQTKYGDIGKLNKAYKTGFGNFSDLEKPVPALSSSSPEAAADMKNYSRDLIRAYVEIPAKACKKADPNHMILGMRWAWIVNPDLIAGWENFDVFSINCYAEDPTASIENVVKLGVDLPVMIGEFHFGALDSGPTATGLEGVRTQKDRGAAFRYYCERAAAHPNGVGCHYFQYYDQFGLGRYDGENYNIGLLDVGSKPYEAMIEQVKLCGEGIYDIIEGRKKPSEIRAEFIPMIAY